MGRCQPHHHGAAVRGNLGRHPNRRLDAGLRSFAVGEPLAAAPYGILTSFTSTSARPADSGVGYGAPASLGAALANKKHGRLTVTIQNDGDLMYAPGVLWTSAHHNIPLLSVMHNNRAYHQEVMRTCSVACATGAAAASIALPLEPPSPIPTSTSPWSRKRMGVYSEGPITDPKDLGSAILRAKEVVKRGEPALVEAVTQPR